jgi:predicted GH43/DUF377 family glycosyl hydrolase
VSITRASFLASACGAILSGCSYPAQPESAAGWKKYGTEPVLGAGLGTCFDVCLLHERGIYRMWFSWRPKRCIACVESLDGVHWGPPTLALAPVDGTWEQEVNRPIVVHRTDGYHMWYTGTNGRSMIGYATSRDGRAWERRLHRPALVADRRWENVAVMAPHVLWDERQRTWRMWYSAGEEYEPNAIGYATSTDGLSWAKESGPVLSPDPRFSWESNRLTAAQIVQHDGWHIAFYIGFRDVDHAQIGLARSRDGIGGWERHPANPIIRPGRGWDSDACYKPFALRDGKVWRLWYNGRRHADEQIGLALHEGDDLGFTSSHRKSARAI